VLAILSTSGLRPLVGDVLSDLVMEFWGPEGVLSAENILTPPPSYDYSIAGPPGYTSTIQDPNAPNVAPEMNEDWMRQTLTLLEEALMKEDAKDQKSMADQPPAGFDQLVQDLLNGAPTDGDGGILATKYRFHCDWCYTALKDTWYTCTECVDYDLCPECFRYNKPNHRHSFDEIILSAVSDEIDILRRLVESIKAAGNAQTAKTRDPKHTFTGCVACQRTPTTGVYYTCLECENIDLCRDCLALPTTRLKHAKHTFVPVKPESTVTPAPSNAAPPAKNVVCDRCHERITGDKWLTCGHPKCYNNIDLHIGCAPWDGDGVHLDSHPLDFAYSSPS